MIRDPSDGSVREATRREVVTPPVSTGGSAKSGLPPIDKDQANEAARLKRSREWLDEYHKRRGAK